MMPLIEGLQTVFDALADHGGLASLRTRVAQAGQRAEVWADERVDSTETWDAFVMPELVPILDALVQHLSTARAQDDTARSAQIGLLETALYDVMDTALRQANLVRLHRVVPRLTTFDPHVHRAVERSAGDPAGVILAVHRVGWTALNPTLSGRTAEVTVAV